MIRILHWRDRCIGCNACVEASFSRWKMSCKDGKSILIGGKKMKDFHFAIAGSDELEENLKAEKNCPVRVIQVQKNINLKKMNF